MGLIPVRTATLRPNVMLGFDIYLRISGKHLLYIKRVDNIEDHRLNNLHFKNVRQVFIGDQDMAAYLEFLSVSSNAALKEKNMSPAVRAQIIGGQSKAAVEDMFENPESKENFQKTQTAAANQVALLLANPEALEQMIKIANYDSTVYQHSVNVATIAIGLAARSGAPVETCQVVGIGGLLHDIGRGTDFEKTDKNTEKYQQHPRSGAGVLLGKKYISKDVLDIILMHEERIDGKGFPGGVKKLDQIFQVVALANFYDRLVTLEGMNPRQAYDTIAAIDPVPYESALITGLKDVLVANKIY